MYELSWITESLAVGHAPMSYGDLEAIEKAGITGIINLCGEFCDLHEIETKQGFQVYYLPIHDECAPDMTALEKAIEWTRQAINAGGKILVHCRHGIGRTGTFVTALLLKDGHDLKTAEAVLKHTRAKPTNYCQWKLLNKFQKKMK